MKEGVCVLPASISSLTWDELLVMTGAFLLRSILASHPHSGWQDPPLYGDYEAQRHWQEITVNLPIQQWYTNSTDNDLNYWGLDYPPLTAYHSYLMGLWARWIDPEYVSLMGSRGKEDPAHRTFMRNTVLLADVLLYFPAAYAFAKSIYPYNSRKSALALALITLYPGQIMIDNGHFQYNNMSLGLFILAVGMFWRSYDILGSVAFSLALNYKQMELYHALPVFFYLLGRCLQQPGLMGKGLKLAGLGLAVIATFAVVWAPFLGDLSLTSQVVQRIFPFNRGVFEDKVANFWCTFNIAIKIKSLLSQEMLAVLCLITTGLLSLPSNLHVMLRPNGENFLYALVNTALVFFLFSFQVHEKSILLVAIPVTLYAGQADKERYSAITSIWFLIISIFSMFPLLYRDGLGLPTLSLSVFFILGSHYTKFLEPIRAFVVKSPNSKRVCPIDSPWKFDQLVQGGFLISMVGCITALWAFLWVRPPGHLPDLWTVIICAYSALHFIGFSIYFHYLQIFSDTVNLSEVKKSN